MELHRRSNPVGGVRAHLPFIKICTNILTLLFYQIYCGYTGLLPPAASGGQSPWGLGRQIPRPAGADRDCVALHEPRRGRPERSGLRAHPEPPFRRTLPGEEPRRAAAQDPALLVARCRKAQLDPPRQPEISWGSIPAHPWRSCLPFSAGQSALADRSLLVPRISQPARRRHVVMRAEGGHQIPQAWHRRRKESHDSVRPCVAHC